MVIGDKGAKWDTGDVGFQVKGLVKDNSKILNV